MKIHGDSHLDHGLKAEHADYLAFQFRDRTAFFIETVELPQWLPAVQCALHGPKAGDAPVPEVECHYQVRGGRKGNSRLCGRPVRQTRTVTVIAGPYEGIPCVLYTAYGGPLAPREPWDETLTEEQREEARAFWAEHALSA